ncbi:MULTISPECIES: PadR family transcriptional regulator [unclassified Mycolicibacterium]|uniref:PadR family transcriptional regulator n=1 Tax=unclassified Mycolicibacterium TaxID=2636767 RepID=UPI0012DF921C|nr:MULTISPECIES: PadR family transcriptional regulator [unclassified Mycolicibacterium]MUL84216.1 helix-turn-helix transcriptional regulator [Mycolicibacterium sp. CBMA 329]MUL89718.1 helix-turn-helix transcriptional regulator [Mycolicibacterium sp. CBMA 331]MUL99893.1 helix-turn-helix transcriptional regulator [Mycolicibacterium sp. CBMA 334]MUM27047.1 helix-turn-helix transcriptional regulator [Mycolicibacterium sp. CBMA 295]MUM39233.1 helix-turn-helix transcriptional regulator [Mycolicibact
MSTPFTPQPGGFGFGFGFGPGDRRAMHQQRRAARREFRDQVRAHIHEAREHDVDPTCQAGFDGPGFGPGFGRGFEFGFDPRGGGFGFGPRGGHRGRGGRRGRRGDVRAAILTLLAERPMHGYEMTQEIATRSNNLWKPSPGSVYPTLQLLVDEGLIVPTETEGSKKTFELTEPGRQAAAQIETPPWEQIAEDADPAAINLRGALGQLMAAVGQSSFTANEDQQQRILDIVNNARREIYQVLGEE